ncbi:class I SAM-dependent methyltransferase [Cotonvirus japonicus]|uniref:Class I SAM-dependent methyltransferase n=1 Tax=Cotonvirus japonicus TaxID=2811091 RepID=A0ABM7NRR0_9VIRU|nr:class I SAM-dependent methyltransferase [Cotonvirus japonicus]BCS82840.1 class I SAM-dependent methyltransferase [Cotonvirus japonicus]
MPWDNRIQKTSAVNIINNVYQYESPFPNYDELEKNPNIVKKFSYGGEDKLALGIKIVDYDSIGKVFMEYLPEWKPSESEEKYLPTINPKYNLAYPEFDAFVLYSFIRHFKPNNIIEIGSGQSTRIMIQAIIKNNNNCKLTCIEPYTDIQYLKDVYPVNVIKDKVENVDVELFKSLGKNDILFIDSSHVLRPFGDVEYEYLHILPIINKDCIVHIHDIFYPYDYPTQWTIDWKSVLTEQQILLAFLYGNSKWRTICPNNYILCNRKDLVPDKIKYKIGGSYWLRKLA